MSADAKLHTLLDEAAACLAEKPPNESRRRQRALLLAAYIADALGAASILAQPWPGLVRQDEALVAGGRALGSIMDDLGRGLADT